MRLILLSNGSTDYLSQITYSFVNKTNPLFTFIAPQSQNSQEYFKKVKQHFEQFGFKEFINFDIDKQFEAKNVSQLLESDVVYLSGGNTFYFLHQLKKLALDLTLKQYANDSQKVLIGVSAGAMILTPTIRNTFVYHTLKGDVDKLNFVHLEDFSGLSLTNFEFIPHFNWESKGEFAKSYLHETKSVVYGCPDECGIVVDGSEITLYGDVINLTDTGSSSS